MKALVAFESVVRHRSVTKAAEELNVTHGAVSKQLASLEDWVGRPLFSSNRRQMEPTEHAILLAGAAEEAWKLIEEAVGKVREQDDAVVVRVLAPSTFAMRWLIPRLWSFAAAHEKIRVQLRQTHSLENWQEIPFDVAIRTENDLPDHLRATPILRDRLTLAIAPGAAESAAIRKPADLRGCRLLRAATRPGELEAWLQAAGLPQSMATQATTLPHFYLALEAALSGAGALVCPLRTVSDLFSKSELKEPFPQLRIPGPVYTAVHDPACAQADGAEMFVRWLARLDDEAAMPSPGLVGPARPPLTLSAFRPA
ncbi:LysR substrate-binding domain-containing protein [Chelativorans sp.]|uniref:LysR substrate-binding domain-containing protein n=1 Tax=Chelativorans sp. TaxID=2203393 RepID=UPI0028123B35|nr:LysR substrate-binding domain-containing protein [Chelativorans sp.]